MCSLPCMNMTESGVNKFTLNLPLPIANITTERREVVRFGNGIGNGNLKCQGGLIGLSFLYRLGP